MSLWQVIPDLHDGANLVPNESPRWVIPKLLMYKRQDNGPILRVNTHLPLALTIARCDSLSEDVMPPHVRLEHIEMESTG